MTGRRGGVGRPVRVVAWLRIDCGQQARGHWVRYPAADYACLRCGAVESATGDQVPAFTATIRRTHAATCTRKAPTP